MTEDEKMYCFTTDLQAEVKLQVELQRPSDLQTAKEIADRADTIIFQAKRFSRGRGGPSSDTASGNWPSQDDEAMKHGATRLTDSKRERYMKEGKFFRCGKKGHRANQHNADGSPQNTRLPWPFTARVRNESSRENKNRTEKRQKETYHLIIFSVRRIERKAWKLRQRKRRKFQFGDWNRKISKRNRNTKTKRGLLQGRERFVCTIQISSLNKLQQH
jgi:hypothetical protein